jgi:hypothetical protein
MKKISSFTLLCFLVWSSVAWAQTAKEKELEAQRDFYKDLSSSIAGSSNTLATWATLFISGAALSLTVISFGMGNSVREARDAAKTAIDQVQSEFDAKRKEIEDSVENKIYARVSDRLAAIRFLSDAEQRIRVTTIAYWIPDQSHQHAKDRAESLQKRGFESLKICYGKDGIATSDLVILDFDEDDQKAIALAGFSDLENLLNHVASIGNYFILFKSGIRISEPDMQKIKLKLGIRHSLANFSHTLVQSAVDSAQHIEAFRRK